MTSNLLENVQVYVLSQAVILHDIIWQFLENSNLFREIIIY